MVPYTVIENKDGLERLAAKLAGEASVAIDTEADSLHSYEGKVCLIQISTRDNNYIVDVLKFPDLEPLRPVLIDPNIEKVLHGADYDVRMLAKCYGLEIRNLFDTMVASQLLGLKTLGLAALLNDNFGVTLDKSSQKADWSKRPLSPKMLTYAAMDTAYLNGLRDILCSKLEEKGRMSWAREEFHLLSLNRSCSRTSVSALAVKGARKLDGRQLAILQEVLEFRDEKARQLDRPPFKVFGNDLLMEIATAAPKSMDSLRTVPGFTSNLLSKYGTELLEAVKKGNNVPIEQCPRFERTERTRKSEEEIQRFDRLKKISSRLAEELAIDPAILCTNAALTTIASSSPSTCEETIAGTLKSWQRQVLDREFLAVCLG